MPSTTHIPVSLYLSIFGRNTLGEGLSELRALKGRHESSKNPSSVPNQDEEGVSGRNERGLLFSDERVFDLPSGKLMIFFTKCKQKKEL